jgi:hypothetical protein
MLGRLDVTVCESVSLRDTVVAQGAEHGARYCDPRPAGVRGP